MNPIGLNQIKIQRIPGGFMAQNSTGHSGCGNTTAEALGCLLLSAPDMFDITSIEYDSDYATRIFLIERGLNPQIISRQNNG